MFDTDEQRSITDRRADATRDAIVEAAWSLSRREGLTGWSLRQLAKEVGLAAPTLYSYVDSKHAIYDLMFQQAWAALGAAAEGWASGDGSNQRESLTEVMFGWFDFSAADHVRYQLMNQRVIADFAPSADAYAASLAAYDRFRSRMAELGVTDQDDLDLWTALSTGLVSQQLANDPGGDRWRALVPRSVEIFCAHVGIEPDPPSSGGD